MFQCAERFTRFVYVSHSRPFYQVTDDKNPLPQRTIEDPAFTPHHTIRLLFTVPPFWLFISSPPVFYQEVDSLFMFVLHSWPQDLAADGWEATQRLHDVAMMHNKGISSL